MRIKKLQIKNFKSLVDFELVDLKPFCAFVGPNASGKSNIFEALEFTNFLIRYQQEAPGFFGGMQSILSYHVNRQNYKRISFDIRFIDELQFELSGAFGTNENKFGSISSRGSVFNFGPTAPFYSISNSEERAKIVDAWISSGHPYDNDFEYFLDNYSRIFIGKSFLNRTPSLNNRIASDGSNLAQIIGRIFEIEDMRNDFIEWTRILIPEFKGIEVKKSNIDGSYDFFIFEKGSQKPFPRNLISDGTYNILALMAAVYQTDEPQFICIEEPENGLHPQAIELLVDFFREKCEEGHHIWLNTHSQTLVRCLEIDEIILVNKVNGATRAKQLTQNDKIDIRTDEAWLTNALGGGVL